MTVPVFFNPSGGSPPPTPAATSLMISYADIGASSISVTATPAADLDYPEYNLVLGPRYWRFRLASNASSVAVVYDLGTRTRAVDHIVIARADVLQAAGCTQIVLASSPDGSSWTTRYTDGSFASATLLGPGPYDYYAAISATPAARYWRLTYTAPGATEFAHAKVYFGTLFDFGQEPDTYTPDRRPLTEDEYVSASDAVSLLRTDESVYRFDFTWLNITDATAESFMSLIVRQAQRAPVFLITRSQHEVLDQRRVLHCQLLQDSVRVDQPTTRKDRNRVQASFVEILG